MPMLMLMILQLPVLPSVREWAVWAVTVKATAAALRLLLLPQLHILVLDLDLDLRPRVLSSVPVLPQLNGLWTWRCRCRGRGRGRHRCTVAAQLESALVLHRLQL